MRMGWFIKILVKDLHLIFSFDEHISDVKIFILITHSPTTETLNQLNQLKVSTGDEELC